MWVFSARGQVQAVSMTYERCRAASRLWAMGVASTGRGPAGHLAAGSEVGARPRQPPRFPPLPQGRAAVGGASGPLKALLDRWAWARLTPRTCADSGEARRRS